jgi:hypothetical protein
MGPRTDIGSLDHAHVVPAISDAADALLGEATDQPGNVCFLRWRAPARDDGRKLRRDLYKLILEQAETQLRETRERDVHVTSQGI